VAFGLPIDQCADVILELFVLELALVDVVLGFQFEVGAVNGVVEQFVTVELLDLFLVVNVLLHLLIQLLEPQWQELCVLVAELSHEPC